MTHLLFQPRRYTNQRIRAFATDIHDARILELGSGKLVDGQDVYSARRFFDPSNEFVQSDVVEAYGHQLVDATTMEFTGAFDVVLCLCVLEHVYDFQLAIGNIHRALKPNGTVLLIVPCTYPLHDEPNDFWRFTEHALRRMFGSFNEVKVSRRGPRAMPVLYSVEARRPIAAGVVLDSPVP